MTENKFVNGPINTIRLEGKVGKINKTIYLFLDVHQPVSLQTECDDIRSRDIDKFLIDNFDREYENNKDQIYDLFLELNPLYSLRFSPTKQEIKGKYLFGQTNKLFEKSINIKSGKVYQSNQLKNVRLHYGDIREYTSRRYDRIMNNIFYITGDIWESGRVFYKDIVELLSGLKIIHAQMTYLYEIIYKNRDDVKPKSKVIFTENQKILSKYSEKDYQEIANRLIYKILRSYKNQHVQEKINHVVSHELHHEFKKFFDEIDDTIVFLNDLANKLEPFENKDINQHLLKQSDNTYFYGLDNINEIICQINTINEKLWNTVIGGVGLYLMDLYLLRRILDKDYVTNAIAYTGAAHSLNYIRILVKYFGFEITHYSYLKDQNIMKAEEKIKQSKMSEELNELFYAPKLKQCSDLNKFPKPFR